MKRNESRVQKLLTVAESLLPVFLLMSALCCFGFAAWVWLGAAATPGETFSYAESELVVSRQRSVLWSLRVMFMGFVLLALSLRVLVSRKTSGTSA